MTERDVTRPLPLLRVERPSAARGADAAREHLDGERCVFCDVPADGREMLDVLGTKRYLPTCGGCYDSPNAAFQRVGENPEDCRFCPTCGHVVRMPADKEMCTGCWAFRRKGELLWYLPTDHAEAVIEAAEADGEAPDPTLSPRRSAP